MIALQDHEYNDLIKGYLQGQFKEWFNHKADLYSQLNLPLGDEIEIILLKIRD